MKKQKTFIDHEGNEVVPFTHDIIKPVVDPNEYKPTKEEIEKMINLPKEPAKLPENLADYANRETIPYEEIARAIESFKDPGLSITEQIKQAEAHLADLKLQKKAEIERRKKELEELEATE